jgi:serine/threonine-protein kinase
VAPFDAGRLEITGPPVPLTDPVRGDGADGSGPVPQLAVARDGTLAYVPSAASTAVTLGLVSRGGVFDAITPSLSGAPVPRISPDGRFVAFQAQDGNEFRVMVYDVARGSTNRLTQSGSEWGPAWRPNGRELAIGSRAGTGQGMFLADLSGARRLLVTGDDQAFRRNASWSPDGETLAYTVQNGGLHDIWILPIDEGASALPFLDGPASEYSPAFSPDGRWLAYVSDESGRGEVYVRGYPQGDRLTVSTDGAQGPVWGPDGSELFFQGQDREGASSLMVASVAPEGGTLRFGAPTKLFDMRVTSPTGTRERYGGSGNVGASYDVFPDGRRFVMSRGPDPRGEREIVLVQNFFEEVRRLAGN